MCKIVRRNIGSLNFQSSLIRLLTNPFPFSKYRKPLREAKALGLSFLDDEFNSHILFFGLKLNDLQAVMTEHISKQSVESCMSSSRSRTWFVKAWSGPPRIAAVLGFPLALLPIAKYFTRFHLFYCVETKGALLPITDMRFLLVGP